MNPMSPFNPTPPGARGNSNEPIDADRLFQAAEAVLLSAMTASHRRRRSGQYDPLDHFSAHELVEGANFLARLGYIRCEEA